MATSTLPRPADRVAVFTLALVFLCGAAVGAVAMSFWIHPALHPVHTAPAAMSVGDWQKQLGLSDDQTRVLTSILDDFSHYYDNVLADGNSRVMQILNPEQKLRYQQMLRERKQGAISPGSR